MTSFLLDTYQRQVSAGELQVDAAQELAAERFDVLAKELKSWSGTERGLGRFFRKPLPPPKGIYLHGDVGRGKTMLMDLFFAAAPVQPRRRVHFHEFMAEVHDRIGDARKTVDGDPIPHVAQMLAKEAKLLCFDELHVTDIADAMILGRLFKVLFDRKVVVVATSNAHPTELYRNGLNRQLFVPFIELIAAHMDVVELDAAKDFRLEKLTGRELYFTPIDDRAAKELKTLWDDLTAGAAFESCSLQVKGRSVHIPRSAMGVAWFSFEELCGRPLGSIDYLAIARAYHTVIVEGIPALPPARRNEARRFINLIDTLYDNKISVVASAADEPGGLYKEGDGVDLFQRTESRLIEMRSDEYLQARAERPDVVGSPAGRIV